MTKELAFSVSIKDCEVQTFRAGGAGGQNQNKRNTGVRVIHHPSGARGECRNHREQLKNKQEAFRRLAKTPRFKAWCARQLREPDARFDPTVGVRVEAKIDGEWIEVDNGFRPL